MTPQELNHELGNIDLYLLDAILKGYVPDGAKVLDAGCGEGRNLHWFLRNGYEAWGLDQNAGAIRMLRFVANSLQRSYPQERFTTGSLEDLPYPDARFDLVICNAVLHFAENEEQFRQQWAQLWRVLQPEGLLFIRTATTLGMGSEELQAAGEGRYLQPDGSYRFLLTEPLLADLLDKYPMQLVEPLKSVVVAGHRSMGVLVLRKTFTATSE